MAVKGGELTEDDWLTGEYSFEMLMHVRHSLSVRKMRLLGVAFGRRLCPWFRPEVTTPALDVAERYADGLASDEERTAVLHSLEQIAGPARWVFHDALTTDRYVQSNGANARAAAQAAYRAGHGGRRVGKNAAALAGEAAQAAEIAAQA